MGKNKKSFSDDDSEIKKHKKSSTATNVDTTHASSSKSLKSGKRKRSEVEVEVDDYEKAFTEMRKVVASLKNAIAADRMWSKEAVDKFFSEEYGLPPEEIYDYEEGDIDIIHDNCLTSDFSEPRELSGELEAMTDATKVTKQALNSFFERFGITTTKLKLTKLPLDGKVEVYVEVRFASDEDQKKALGLTGQAVCGSIIHFSTVISKVKPYFVTGLVDIDGFSSGEESKVLLKLREIFESHGGSEVKIFHPKNKRGEMKDYCFVRVKEKTSDLKTALYKKDGINVSYIDHPTSLLMSKWQDQAEGSKATKESKKAKCKKSAAVPAFGLFREAERKVERKDMVTDDENSSKLLTDIREIIAICNDALTKISNVPKQKSFSDALHLHLKKRFTISRFSWIDHKPEIIPPQHTQRRGYCWAIALFRLWYCFRKLLQIPLLLPERITVNDIESGVDAQYINENGGICHIAHAAKFMAGQRYIKKMNVYVKPENRSCEPDFENFIERLVRKKSPIVAGITSYPSYGQLQCRGVLCPTKEQREMAKYMDVHVGHNFLLTGFGVDHTTGKPIPYWEGFESQGSTYGEAGFFRIRRGRGLITEAVQLEVDRAEVRARKNALKKARARKNARR